MATLQLAIINFFIFQMAIGEQPQEEEGAGDSPTTAVPAVVVTSGGSIAASESTLLTPAQTYFADEKIVIPEVESVSYSSNRTP